LSTSSARFIDSNPEGSSASMTTRNPSTPL
jgi:hypothetical protein